MAEVTRRSLLAALGSSALLSSSCAAKPLAAQPKCAASASARAPASQGTARAGASRRNRIKQGVALWCWGMRKVSPAQLCKEAKAMGLAAIDMVRPKYWSLVRDHGLVAAVGVAQLDGLPSIPHGVNDPKFHGKIIAAMEKNIPKAAAAGVPNLVCSFGNRVAGMSRAAAIKHSITCLERCKAVAEQHGVTIVLEILNSKRDHKGYIGDSSSYALEIVKAVNSPRIKLLFDIYHAQVSEGDVIETIRTQSRWIGHYQTAGNPGRHEIDDTQELNYPAIVRAIIATGYSGYLTHEFIPRGPDPIASLREAVRICDV